MRLFFKSKPFRLLFIIFSFYLLCWLISTQTKLVECSSDSLSGFRYALFLRTSHLKRGDIVFIQNHKASYVGDLPLGKRILGLPGDRLLKDEKEIRIDSSSSRALYLLKHTKEGQPLTMLKTAFVPKGYAFVAGDHPRSFDSRYEEFGVVPLEKIWGKAVIAW